MKKKNSQKFFLFDITNLHKQLFYTHHGSSVI